MAKHIHIVGGGLAGLSAAVSLSGQPDIRISIYEGSPSFGGRARSYNDSGLNRLIDNGNHLILSGNEAVFKYLWKIGATQSLTGPKVPLFPFVDLEENKRWDLLLSKGKFPWWLFSSKKRVPGFHFPELLSLWNLVKANSRQTVADCLINGEFARRLLQPFSVSALNTSCEMASASLLGSVIKQSLLKGGKACIPYFPKEGLSESFVKPALSLLKLQGGGLHLTSRISEIGVQNNRVDYFVVNGEKIVLGPQDTLILALHAYVAEKILRPICPNIQIPNQFESILNLHFAVDRDLKIHGNIGRAKFVGVIGGISEWLFFKDGVISVTISAANRFTGCKPENIVPLIWQEIQKVFNPVLSKPLSEQVPVYRLLWEKRASFMASAEQNNRRPGCYTPFSNLFLAGDWTATGLPSTLEGTIRSGFNAAQATILRE